MAAETEAPTRAEIDAEHERLQAEGRLETGPQDVHDGDEPVMRLDGFEDLVGGKAPTTVKVRLLGGGIEVEPPAGGFKKGEPYVFRIEARARKVEFTDEVDDKTGQVTGCARGTGLRITGAALLDEAA